jgi:hypothetical protein
MISTAAGGMTNPSQVLTPNISGATPGMSITDQTSTAGAAIGEGPPKNSRSQHPASGNLIAQIVAKAQEANQASSQIPGANNPMRLSAKGASIFNSTRGAGDLKVISYLYIRYKL